MGIDEGYIKFSFDWKQQPVSIPDNIYKEINYWRTKLVEEGFIGMFENGIGFGNISIRIKDTNRFYISGSATGGIKILEKKHYAEVVDFEIEKNCLSCIGEVPASSESLSHAALYQADENICGIVHTHNIKMWKSMKNILPTTAEGADYGTPEIALELQRIIQSGEAGKEKLIVLGGHEEGIITFGQSLKEAFDALMKNN